MNTSTSKVKSKPLTVPSVGENAAERKRVLNVLAQRRYRRKKKDQIQRLEGDVLRDQISNAQSPADQSKRDTSLQRNTIDSHELGAPGLSTLANDAQSSAFDDFFQVNQYPLSASTDVFEINPHDFMIDLPELSSGSSLTSPCSIAEAIGVDEFNLPMLELNLLRGAVAIAKRLSVDDLIWSLDSLSPFYGSMETFSQLPSNLTPTAFQRQHPHHPALDILPWPTVRDKLILVFSQPLELRPPSAKSPLALVNFIYDLEDPAEGVRIWGDDPYSDQNWEVGQKLFSNWWWALDNQVLKRSNELRLNRGASLLGSERVVEVG